MKILIIAYSDYAGSGYQMKLAIESIGYKSDLAIFKEHKFNYKYDFLIKSKYQLNQLIKRYDIIHFKGDWLPSEQYGSINHSNKYMTAGGSIFRRKTDNTIGSCLGLYSFEQYYKEVKHISVLTPDLLYTELINPIWIPHPYKVIGSKWQYPSNRIIITHSPTSEKKKGTYLFEQAVQKLNKMGYYITIKYLSEMSNADILIEKAKGTFHFDQNVISAYGMNTVECLSMGIPVFSYINEEVRTRDNKLNNLPSTFYTDNSVNGIVECIGKAIDGNIRQLSEQTMDYFRDTHLFNKVGEKIVSIY